MCPIWGYIIYCYSEFFFLFRVNFSELAKFVLSLAHVNGTPQMRWTITYIITEWRLQYLISSWKLNTSLPPLLVRSFSMCTNMGKRFLLRTWLTWLCRPRVYTIGRGLRAGWRPCEEPLLQFKSRACLPEVPCYSWRSVFCSKYLDLQLIGWGWPIIIGQSIYEVCQFKCKSYPKTLTEGIQNSLIIYLGTMKADQVDL